MYIYPARKGLLMNMLGTAKPKPGKTPKKPRTPIKRSASVKREKMTPKERKARRAKQGKALTAEKRRLRAKADRAMQDINRQENSHCEYCGSPNMIVGHHYFPTSQSSNLRYDFLNIIILCRGCHNQHHNGSNPEIHHFIDAKRGDPWFDDLQSRKSRDKERGVEELQEIIDGFKARLEGGRHE